MKNAGLWLTFCVAVVISGRSDALPRGNVSGQLAGLERVELSLFFRSPTEYLVSEIEMDIRERLGRDLEIAGGPGPILEIDFEPVSIPGCESTSGYRVACQLAETVVFERTRERHVATTWQDEEFFKGSGDIRGDVRNAVAVLIDRFCAELLHSRRPQKWVR